MTSPSVYLVIIVEGSHKTSCGKSIIITMPRIARIVNGMIERYISPMETPIGPARLFM